MPKLQVGHHRFVPSSVVLNLPRFSEYPAVQMANVIVKIQAQDNGICQAIKNNVPQHQAAIKRQRKEMDAGMGPGEESDVLNGCKGQKQGDELSKQSV